MLWTRDGFRVIDSGASVTSGAGCASVNAAEAFCPLPGFALSIHVVAGDMDDSVLVTSYRYDMARLEGGDGADELEGGGGTDILDGGEGPDDLSRLFRR